MIPQTGRVKTTPGIDKWKNCGAWIFTMGKRFESPIHTWNIVH
jgi:hypothetical protein